MRDVSVSNKVATRQLFARWTRTALRMAARKKTKKAPSPGSRTGVRRCRERSASSRGSLVAQDPRSTRTCRKGPMHGHGSDASMSFGSLLSAKGNMLSEIQLSQ